MLVACSTDQGAAGSSFKPVSRGVLTVATAFLPAPGFWEGRPPVSGFEAGLAAALARRLGLDRVRVVQVPFTTILRGKLAGADMALSQLTPTKERERLFDEFRRGEIRVLVVSKVANFSIDLPEANVAVQVSGTFGSRQEEAQRLGRLLRPKADGGGAIFYSVVSRDSLDAEYAAHRQRFLAEQGYGYVIKDADDLLGPAI